MKPATDEEYDSPKPPRTNATPGPNRVASAVAMAASDQMISASENPLRVPRRSMIRPAKRKPIA